MQSIIYTDTDRIRSVLGVDDKDIKDNQVTDRDLEKELRLDLLSWVSNHAALYTTGTTGTPTEPQKSVADALTLYSTYFCAILVVKSLQLAAPQAIADGKNSLSRFAAMDWQGMSAHLKERAAFYKTFIQDATATNAVTVYTAFAGVGLAVDPVTSV